MALLIVTAAALIVFLLVEGSKKLGPPPAPSPAAGFAGASGSSDGSSSTLPTVDTSSFDAMFGPAPTGSWNSPEAAAADNAAWGVDPFRPSLGG